MEQTTTPAVGGILEFGRYPQGAEGEILPLRWIILALRDGHALLTTDKLIECMPFHTSPDGAAWEASSLRAWLNGEFLRSAFDEAERARVLRVSNPNPANPKFGGEDGAPTPDSVFLLSMQEYDALFPPDADRRIYATPHAVQRGAKGGSQWWLRTSCDVPQYAACVHYLGGVNSLGNPVTDASVGVRPALWVRLPS